MKTLKKVITDIWTNKLSDKFSKGLLTYERQLQAELYYQLKLQLSDEYEIWIEPVVYLSEHGLDKVKPDIFITKGDTIVGIIELKFKPWEHPKYQGDINKLIKFDLASDKNLSLPFGYKPTSSDWKKQISSEMVRFNLTQDHLNCFIVFGKPDSEAIKPNHRGPKNFIHLYGYIDDNVGAKFEWTEN